MPEEVIRIIHSSPREEREIRLQEAFDKAWAYHKAHDFAPPGGGQNVYPTHLPPTCNAAQFNGVGHNAEDYAEDRPTDEPMSTRACWLAWLLIIGMTVLAMLALWPAIGSEAF
jgi:hypothetical protein